MNPQIRVANTIASRSRTLLTRQSDPNITMLVQQSYSSRAKSKDKKSNAYSHTLKLPKTAFPLRADAAHREPLFRDRCTDELYQWQLKERPLSDQFVLHDGPPYANGDLHIGHFMNKVLKDIISRYQLMQGKQVLYIPGFDTHGLPIEQKALAKLNNRDRDTLDPMAIRKLARAFALKAIANQTKGFREYAIMGDWTNPYVTLDPQYEARQLEVFKTMVMRGYIYRQNKPVYWSPSSRTALAEAELEYNDKHVSTSVFVRFPLTSDSVAKIRAQGQVNLLIWTTTPWTLPANCAVAVHPNLEYCLVKVIDGSNASKTYQMLVGKERLDYVRTLLPEGSSVSVQNTYTGKDLEGLKYQGILRGDKEFPILLGDHVAAESGTGLVHSAPGHGKEDYELGLANGIEAYSPVDDHGCFTNDAGPVLAGKNVQKEGTTAVLEMLEGCDALLSKAQFTHSYPYDWRTKQPVIQRATPQWFADVKDLKRDACDSLQNVQMIPESGRRRLSSFVNERSEWCISRQRVWGVPIPVLYNSSSGEPLLTAKSIDHIIGVIRSHGGTNSWWTLPAESFVAPQYQQNGETYIKGTDTMDVWFDSGSSWKLLESKAKDGQAVSDFADLYLEGSDQHRGWFQSSLLTSNAVRGVAPYKAIVTHGFTLDEQGRKMSKSIGNTIVPDQVIHGGKDKKKEPAYGVDLLRLVVGSTDYTQDVNFGPRVFASFGDTIRKIRSTIRFMLGNLDGFQPHMVVPYSELTSIDRYMLHELYHFKQHGKKSFASYEFFRAMQSLNHFTNSTLSAFYFDISKDRLYADKVDERERRSTQTTLRHILVNYVTSLAPVTPHLAEEVWEFSKEQRQAFGSDVFSVFQENWGQTDVSWDSPELASEWMALRKVRALTNRAIETARQNKVIGSSLEAELDIYVDPQSALGQLLGGYEEDMCLICITSGATIREHDAGCLDKDSGERLFVVEDTINAFGSDTSVRVECRRSSLHKCPRCWNFHSAEPDSLCMRCGSVVSG